MVAVPSPLLVKVTPEGSAPLLERVAAGYPVVVTVKLPELPTTRAALLADVMAGAWLTVRVKDWVASGTTVLVAVMVSGKTPLAVGVPDSVAVPLPLSTKVTPEGSAPVSVRPGVGFPVAVTLNVLAVPTVKVMADVEMIVGAWETEVTDSVKLWIAGEPIPLLAVMVIGKLPLEVGLPERLAVPSPLSTKVTPVGSVPVSARLGVGLP